jgi:hypothetical protein
MSRYVIEIEPEVRQWLDSLSDHDYGRAEFYADLLADNAETLGEPYSRHLAGQSPRTSVSPTAPAGADHLLARPQASG